MTIVGFHEINQHIFAVKHLFQHGQNALNLQICVTCVGILADLAQTQVIFHVPLALEIPQSRLCAFPHTLLYSLGPERRQRSAAPPPPAARVPRRDALAEAGRDGRCFGEAWVCCFGGESVFQGAPAPRARCTGRRQRRDGKPGCHGLGKRAHTPNPSVSGSHEKGEMAPQSEHALGEAWLSPSLGRQGTLTHQVQLL